jgi:glycosyltransferase involved in cell wall biosynthesis
LNSISVAMATYNGARFIREQLDSIAAQTVPPAELVVTDDGSTDDTLGIVRTFAGTAPFPVHVYENSARLGFRANFMRSIGLCASDVIALCDQDDVWAPNKLERMSQPFEDPEVLLSYHEAWLIDSAGKHIGLAHIYPLLSTNGPSSANPMRNPYGFSMVFRRRLLDFADLWEKSVDNLQLNDRMAHDQWVFFLASALGTVAFIEEPLAGYRQHGNNTYGYDRPASTRRARFTNWVTVRSQDYVKFTVAAEARAAILEQLSGRLNQQGRARASLAIERYRALVRHSALRAQIYGPTGLGDRLHAWVGLLRDGGYGSATRWLFGRKAALKDLSYLILPKWLIGALLLPESAARSTSANGPSATSPSNGVDGTAATSGS